MGLTSAEGPGSPPTKDLRIVLLGKTGSGKSATGNTILERTAFVSETSPVSVTKKCAKEVAHFDERTVTIIDTPGIFDTSIGEEELKREIENCVMMSVPGPHVFLLVISLGGRFTAEERNAIKWINENFGEEASKYTVVVFTRVDELRGTTIEGYLSKSSDLTKLIRDDTAGYVTFDNTCMQNRTQVAELLEKIDAMVHLNAGHYTSSIYQEAQRKLWWSNVGKRVKTAGPYLIGAATAGAATATAAAPFVAVAASAADAPFAAAAAAAADAAGAAAAAVAGAAAAAAPAFASTVIRFFRPL